MTSNNTNTIEYIGPFEEWRITLNGYLVPRLTGRVIGGTAHLYLDNRIALDVPEEIALQVVDFVANAMAIGAGYSCFGENSKPLHPFHRRMYGINVAEAESDYESVTEVPQ